MDDIINCFKQAFATNFQYYTKAHGYHVNVIGTDFYEYHKLLQKIYEDSQNTIDDYAEHLRIIDGVVPFNLTRITELGLITDATDSPIATKMIKDLYDDTEILIKCLTECYELADAQKLYGIQNFIQARIDAHNKFCWMLRVTLE
jgi:starvation-inducible DNA-binding protein